MSSIYKRSSSFFLKNSGILGISYKLQPCLLKQELDHHETYEVTKLYKDDEWLPQVKNDVLSTAFAYARYSKGKEIIINFGMKYSSSLPSLANKAFNSLGNGNDEPFYTYNDKHMRWFVRRAIKS